MSKFQIYKNLLLEYHFSVLFYLIHSYHIISDILRSFIFIVHTSVSINIYISEPVGKPKIGMAILSFNKQHFIYSLQFDSTASLLLQHSTYRIGTLNHGNCRVEFKSQVRANSKLQMQQRTIQHAYSMYRIQIE